MPRPAHRRALFGVGAALVLTLGLAACGSDSGYQAATAGACDGKLGRRQTLTVWSAAASRAEQGVMNRQVATFNSSQSDIQVQLTHIPEREYNARVDAAAAAGSLPDVLEMQSPMVASYAWRGDLQPLYSCLSDDLKANLTPRMISQGSWRDTLYGVGGEDTGLALYARRSVLSAQKLRIPAGPEDAWTVEELGAALTSLRKAGYPNPLQLEKGDTRSDWVTFSGAPIVWSAGGDLIDRDGLRSAQGQLNAKPVVTALKTLQSWTKAGLINPDPDAFTQGRAALAWGAQDRFADYAASFNDLLVLPLPDWGNGTRTSTGSWQWGISTTADDGDAAWLLVNFLLADDQVIETTRANGAVPATRSALDRSPQLGPGQPQALFARQLQDPDVGVARPGTPAYPVISASFTTAMREITEGADVQGVLDKAVSAIDADIARHDGYTPPD